MLAHVQNIMQLTTHGWQAIATTAAVAACCCCCCSVAFQLSAGYCHGNRCSRFCQPRCMITSGRCCLKRQGCDVFEQQSLFTHAVAARQASAVSVNSYIRALLAGSAACLRQQPWL
jgi:hypothetical protein